MIYKKTELKKHSFAGTTAILKKLRKIAYALLAINKV